jgi:predicted phage baseplate assembly protein
MAVPGADSGWQEWTEVESFGASGPGDRHVRLDRTLGEVAFGPAVREPDGSLRRYGAVPDKGARIRVRRYRTGGGRSGNVAAHSLTVLRSSIPYVARVDNRSAATGGLDGESVESAKLRGPIELRSQDRAVTARDFELLAHRAAPTAARIRCVTAGQGAPAGAVRVLVVPEVAVDRDRLRIDQLVPPDRMLAEIARYLDERRQIGTLLVVEPPLYQGVTVVARLVAAPGASAPRVRARALDALYRYIDPLVGGPEGTGWPFGRPVQAGEAHAVLQGVSGVEMVEDLRLFPADPLAGRRGNPTDRVEVDRHALAFSFEHQILVEEQ